MILTFIRLFFANLVFRAQTVFYQVSNYSKTAPKVYIRQVWLNHVICQVFNHLANILANIDGLLVLELYHLANTLVNINDIPKIYFYHLANALTYTNSIPKMDLYHLANIVTNTNDKTDNFIKDKVWLRSTNCSLFITRWRSKIITSYINNMFRPF